MDGQPLNNSRREIGIVLGENDIAGSCQWSYEYHYPLPGGNIRNSLKPPDTANTLQERAKLCEAQ